MEHYITKIHIDQVRHLHDVDIALSPNKRTHLILTGKNGSGKTSLLEAIKTNLHTINEGKWNTVKTKYPEYASYSRRQAKADNVIESERYTQKKNAEKWEKQISDAKAGIELIFNAEDDLDAVFQQGEFITAYFSASRMLNIVMPRGVEDVKLKEVYQVNSNPVTELVKYLVHLKTQQAYAKNEGDSPVEEKISNWFKVFEKSIQRLMDDDSIRLKYDYKNYNFTITQNDRNEYSFTQLSDGYSAAIQIVADLMMRMDQNWLTNNKVASFDMEGIALIDEIETHLHMELQRSILPFLTEMFPRIQFIVATHSAFVVNSLENAVIYDLQSKTFVDHGLTNVTYEGIVEGYFKADTLSETLRDKFERYKALVHKSVLTDDDYNEIMDLEQYLDEIPDYLSIQIAAEYARLKLEFRNREDSK